MCVCVAERLDTMSSIKLGGFQSQLEASCGSSHTEELLYNETSLSIDDNVYAHLPGVEHSGEGINSCQPCNVKVF